MLLSKKASSFASFCEKKIIQPSLIEERILSIRSQGKSIATLNGSFDLLHAGHLEIIYEASQQADILLMALNSDHSIKRYKGAQRPFVPLNYRLQLLSALSFVDFVTWFDELDPRALLEKIQPSVHVNGAEYGENCIEADVVRKHGGKIHIVRLVEGLSTSSLVKKIIDSSMIKEPSSCAL